MRECEHVGIGVCAGVNVGVDMCVWGEFGGSKDVDVGMCVSTSVVGIGMCAVVSVGVSVGVGICVG